MNRAETWTEAFDCAARFAPADNWRQSLAAALKNASGATYAVVCTCPPGFYVEPAATAHPPEYMQLMDLFLRDFLPHVERSGDGGAMAQIHGPGTYAPLDLARDQSLAARFQKEVLDPHGIQGLLNSFLLGRSGEILGWFVLGTPDPSSSALSRLAGPVTELSVIAAATLQTAIDLAAACGVATPNPEAKHFNKLTPREREVARLAAQGLSDEVIAALLDVSEGTVGVHLKRIYNKVDVRSRSELTSKLGTLLNRGGASKS